MAVLLSVLILLGADGALAPAHTKKRCTVAPADSLKSPRRAVLYSLGATVLPIGAGTLLANAGNGSNDLAAFTLIMGGIIVGPSAGHFYADNRRRAWMGVGLRAAGSAVMISGAVLVEDELSGRGDLGNAGSLLALGGMLLTSGSAAYDLFTAPRSAHAYNVRNVRLSVQPTVNPSQKAAGLALSMRF